MNVAGSRKRNNRVLDPQIDCNAIQMVAITMDTKIELAGPGGSNKLAMLN